MIKEYKKNETQYIKKCKYCKSKFLYENEDYYSDYNYGRKNIKCPYCREVNKVRFKTIFKDDEQIKDDIRKEYNELKTRFDNSNDRWFKENQKLFDEKKKMESEYKEKLEKKELKENKIKKYINNYMSSDKKSNIAIKHLKVILELLEEIE